MKKLLTLFFSFSLSIFSYAQKQASVKDSIQVFYDELFSVLKKGYLHKNSVNLPAIETETKQNLSQYGNFKTSLSEINLLFDKIGANLCGIYYQNTIPMPNGMRHTTDA